MTSESTARLRLEYEENISSWRSKWGWSLGGAVLMGLYGYTEAQAVADSNEAQAALKVQALAATTVQEYESLLAQIRTEKEAGETHGSNSQAGYGVSLLLSGLWLWIYLDEPDAPPAEAGLRFQIPAIVHDGSDTRLLLTWRW